MMEVPRLGPRQASETQDEDTLLRQKPEHATAEHSTAL